MMTSRTLTLLLVTVLFVTVGLCQRAEAYIDLGTGSYLLQLLVAGFLGTVFTAKSLWARVRAILSSPVRSGKR